MESGQVTLDDVSIGDQLADILNKPLDEVTFKRLRAQFGLK